MPYGIGTANEFAKIQGIMQPTRRYSVVLTVDSWLPPCHALSLSRFRSLTCGSVMCVCLGTIPSQLGQLNKLRILALDDNQLTGVFCSMKFVLLFFISFGRKIEV